MIQKKCLAVYVALFISAPVSALDLLEVYEMALQNDPLLKQALANRKAARETKNISIAQMLPTISALGESNFNRLNNEKINPQGTGIQEYYEHSYSIDLKQPIFHWDHWVQLSQSDNKIAQAEAEYQAELLNLITRTAEAYFNLLSALDNLEFTLAEKDAIGRQLEQAEKRFNVGLMAITNVHEAQAGFDLSRSDELSAINQRDNAKEALQEIITDFDAPLATLDIEIPLIRPVPDNIETWNNNAQTLNLTIISAFNEAEAARKKIELQRSNHYPKLDLIASHRESTRDSSFGLTGEQQQIGLQLNVPLLEGGSVYFRTRQAKQEYIQAKEKLIVTQRAAKRQVKDSFRGVISSISRVEALKAAVISGESALDATEAGFNVGTRTMVDVLTATRNLTRARSEHSQARYQYLINSIKLKQSASNLSIKDLQVINSYLQKTSNPK